MKEKHETPTPNQAEFRELKEDVRAINDVLKGVGVDPGVIGIVARLGDTVYNPTEGLRHRVKQLEDWRSIVKEQRSYSKGQMSVWIFFGGISGSVLTLLAKWLLHI